MGTETEAGAGNDVRLKPVTSLTPEGTLVVLIEDSGEPTVTRTRSPLFAVPSSREPLVMVEGRAGGYLASRVFELADRGTARYVLHLICGHVDASARHTCSNGHQINCNACALVERRALGGS